MKCDQIDSMSRDPNKASEEWIKALNDSDLQWATTDSFRRAEIERRPSHRPRIAILDIGYDGNSRFLSNKDKKRLNLDKFDENHDLYHWKDFWADDIIPIDEDGHGTYMLSIVLKVAPFAEICVARIASSTTNLRADAAKTGTNLSKVILFL